ncbi:MAG TPA: hypothetical protein PKW80_15695 [Bacteroidales bacterium]|nr:hypothetical protein [Bacteroidales bacterium]
MLVRNKIGFLISIFYILDCGFNHSILSAQARLVFNGDGSTKTYMVMSNGTQATPIYLVVDNPDENAVSRTGTEAGWIISENEFHIVRWNLQANTGNYPVPFGAAAGSEAEEYIPLTFGKTSSDPTDVLFATYGTDVENSLFPSIVTNMYDPYGGTPSGTIIDRFYLVDVTGLATATVNFSYRSIENITTSFPAGLTYAQQWNDAAQQWMQPVGPGVAGVTVNTGSVPSGSISSFAYSKAWVLNRTDNPLPIVLLDFFAECDETHIDLTWSTASEINNDYFTIQRSLDAQNFIDIGYLPGAGNSNGVLYYHYTDNNTFNNTVYYRLKQTDYDGSFSYSGIVAVLACNTYTPEYNVFFSQHAGKIVVQHEGEDASPFTVSMQNVIGQQIIAESGKNLNRAELDVSYLAFGIYLVVVRTDKENFTQKVYLTR